MNGSLNFVNIGTTSKEASKTSKEKMSRFAKFAGSMLLLGMTLATPSAAWAVCVANASTPEMQASFRTAPERLLALYPFGSGGLIGEIRNLVVADPSLAARAVSLLRQASPRQKSAIAAGLAQAALACNTIDQAAALLIQQVVASGDIEFQTAFAIAMGDIPTSTIDGGPAAGGADASTIGSNPARGGGSVGGSTPNGASGVSFSGVSFFGGGGGAAFNGFTANAVSPVRP